MVNVFAYPCNAFTVQPCNSSGGPDLCFCFLNKEHTNSPSPPLSFGTLDLPGSFTNDPSDDAFINAASITGGPLSVECPGCSMCPFCEPRFDFLLGYPAGDHSPTLLSDPWISVIGNHVMTPAVVAVKKAKKEKVFTVPRLRSARLVNAGKSVKKPTKGESHRATYAITLNLKAST